MLRIWSRLGLQKKIFVGLAAMLLLMAAMLVVSFVSQRIEDRLSDRLLTRLLPAREAIRNVKRLIIAADDEGAWYLLSNDPVDRYRFLQRYRSNVRQIEKRLREADKPGEPSQERAALNEARRQWMRYVSGNERAFRLSATGRKAQAQALYTTFSPLTVVAALNSSEQAVQLQIDGVQTQRASLRQTMQLSVVSLGVAAIGFAVVIAVRLGGSLRRRLAAVSGAIADVHTDFVSVAQSFRDIADGDLNAHRYVCAREPIEDSAGDELGLLARSYNELIGGLREMGERIEESVSDARRRKEAEERLAYLEQYDEVTGLANRQLFRVQLDHAIRSNVYDTACLGVAYLGLQGFKKIEVSFGREFAESAIELLAQRLSREVRASDIPARAGEDEFVVALSPVADRDEAAGMARRLIEVLSLPISLNGHEMLVNASAGMSMYPDDGQEADELMRNANTAMSYARQSGSGVVAPYSPRLRTQSLERLTIESELRRALDSSEFELHYQPIVNTDTRSIACFEALLRWRHPRLGLLEPAAFVDVVEETPMIESVGGWVLQNACAQVQEWRRDGHDVGLSVNVSMRQFRGDLFKIVDEALALTGFPAGELELELTESAILTDRPAVRAALALLKRAGVGVAIDDFGTGYSSLAYLQTFPLDTLKIDKSFVTNITRKPYDETIAHTIILLAQSLGMRVIAEGVEDVHQASILHRLGCRLMQGFFFGKPCPADRCLQMLQTAAT